MNWLRTKSGLTLSISLHALNDEFAAGQCQSTTAIPSTSCSKPAAIISSRPAEGFPSEYALIEGVNDEICHANELADRLKGMAAHVNLIPVNPVKKEASSAAAASASRRSRRRWKNEGGQCDHPSGAGSGHQRSLRTAAQRV